MNQQILRLAKKRFKELSRKYDGFINVGVDNWRGYRFIFDTIDVRKCKNNCFKCQLYQLLKNEGGGLFSGGLYPTGKKDKELFGPQNFLNCKTLQQYQNCYINFIVREAKTEKEIEKELLLIKNFKIIFSKENKNIYKLEKQFQQSVIKTILLKSSLIKRRIILRIWQNLTKL